MFSPIPIVFLLYPRRPVISSWLAEAWTLFVKEWRCELRTRYALSTIILFALSTLVAVSLALGPVGGAAIGQLLPVLLWLILLFAAIAGLPRTFVHEEEGGTADALRLSVRPSALFCGKALYNLTLLALLEALVAPLFVILLDLPIVMPGRFVAALAAGGLGLAATSTLLAAIVAQAKVRGTLFPVLAFPILLPLLKLAIEAHTGAVLGEVDAVALPLAFLYDAMVIIAGLMLFPVVWNP